MSDREDKLYQIHSDAMSKARYFVMGVNASAVAFAFHETSNRHLSVSLYVIGAAVLIWALGFGAGIRVVSIHRETVGNNLRMLMMHRLGHGLPQEITKPDMDDVIAKLDRLQDRAPFFGNALDASLPIGALVYLVGHILFLASLPNP